MTNKKSLLAKYGTPEAVSAEMRRRGQLSMLNPNRQKGRHKGGFSYMTPEERSEISRKGALARWGRKDNASS